MIVSNVIMKKPKEVESTYLHRAMKEINLRAIESGQSLLNIIPYKSHLITIWEMTPDAQRPKPKESEGGVKIPHHPVDPTPLPNVP